MGNMADPIVMYIDSNTCTALQLFNDTIQSVIALQ